MEIAKIRTGDIAIFFKLACDIVEPPANGPICIPPGQSLRANIET